MAEIRINISELDNLIYRIQTVKTAANNIFSKNIPPETIGGGLTVREIEELANLYRTVYKDIEDLASNTVLFLQNVKDDFIGADETAANRMTNISGSIEKK